MKPHHYVGSDLIVRKLEVGSMENNVYVLECPETHRALLIDACTDAQAILAGCVGASIEAIVQTHGHADHIQALGELKRALDVPVAAHPAETYPVPIDRPLSDGDEITFGERSALVMHTPGHSAGSVCLLVGRHLISGDTLFPGGPGNTWGDAAAFEQIIAAVRDRLFTLPDDTVVYPGHGLDTTIGRERPFLQEWIERGW